MPSVRIHVHDSGRDAIAARLGPEVLTDDPADADFVVLPGQRGWVIIGDYDGTIRTVVDGSYDIGTVSDIVASRCQEA